MPLMDGPTMVRHVKGLKPDLPVIFMSGYAEEAFRRNDENASDLHFLPKPFGLKQLAAKVKEVLSGAAPLSALGYFVFEPNPRGSFGQGEKYVQANRKDFGYGDLRDILAGASASPAGATAAS